MEIRVHTYCARRVYWRSGGGEGEKMRDACHKREREKGVGVVVGGTTSVAPTEREIFAKSRQVALVELCSYFPSTHPMMSTVM